MSFSCQARSFLVTFLSGRRLKDLVHFLRQVWITAIFLSPLTPSTKTVISVGDPYMTSPLTTATASHVLRGQSLSSDTHYPADSISAPVTEFLASGTIIPGKDPGPSDPYT